MGVNTNFKYKNLRVNTSWKRFGTDRDVTIERVGTFTPNSTFFTIGSCFANELRHALEMRNLSVLPKINPAIHHLFPQTTSKLSWGQWDERAQLQFYNTFSIRQEFEKAFDQWKQTDDDYFKVTHGGVTKYWDPYRRDIYATSHENFVAIKKALDESLSTAIHNADATVITLGMTETFFRKDNGLAVCQYNRSFADFVEFRNTTYEENFANVDRICELYFGQYPGKKIVLTVSPVALAQTFTENDIVVANMESKATLRTVAAAIARKWPNVIYWPSYEIVMWNDNSWQPDIRHVHPDRVATIMDAFLECHIIGLQSNKSATEWDERNRRIEQQVGIGTAVLKQRANQEELKKLEVLLELEQRQLERAEALQAEITRRAAQRAEIEAANAKLKHQSEQEKIERQRAVQLQKETILEQRKQAQEARLQATRDRALAKRQAQQDKENRAISLQAERQKALEQRKQAQEARLQATRDRALAKTQAQQDKENRAISLQAERQKASEQRKQARDLIDKAVTEKMLAKIQADQEKAERAKALQIQRQKLLEQRLQSSLAAEKAAAEKTRAKEEAQRRKAELAAAALAKRIAAQQNKAPSHLRSNTTPLAAGEKGHM